MLDRDRWTSYKVVALVVVAVPATAQNASIPYFPAAGDAHRQGFVRLVNHASQGGEVTIHATDDAGTTYDPISLMLNADQVVHFNSDDLEDGNVGKGIATGTGRGEGDWRLAILSDFDLEALAYIRTGDGFLTPMLDVVPGIGNRHRVPIFNPGRNADQVSELRLVNPGSADVEATLVGIDDQGNRAQLVLAIPAGRSLRATARDLESGVTPSTWPNGALIDGALGEGTGKRQLVLTTSDVIVVMSLLSTPTGHVTNLSDVATLRWRGVVVEPPSRCPGHAYDRDEYGSRYRSKEDDIVDELGAIYGPYSGRCYESTSETTIDHIVALHEAHHSGMCFADTETKRRFGGDLLNLTLAAGELNGAKGASDAFDWMPERNRCWFAERVRSVKLKYGMTVDRDEAAALERVLAGCEYTDIVRPACAE